jgi:hypothetical protein
MTRDDAKRILACHRPWAGEPADSETNAALELVRQDADLSRWFAQHCARQEQIRESLRRVKPPAGLREQILSERPAPAPVSARRKMPALITAALLLLGLAGASFWLTQRAGTNDELSYTNYRSRMVRTALRRYSMDLETNNPTVIRAFLAEHHARADYQLPPRLAAATSAGCGVLKWQGHPVTMVCFKSGRPLKPTEKADLFLFVINRQAAPDIPVGSEPQVQQVNKLMTASWSAGDNVYLLATPGDEAFLAQFL